MLDEFPSLERLGGTKIAGYRLDQMVSRSPLGVVYIAQRTSDNGSYLLRIIAPQPSTPGRYRSGVSGNGVGGSAGYLGGVSLPGVDDTEDYLARFQRQAAHLATLQHPYILPLVDFGVVHEAPYLVWPYLPLRSLATRLTQSGPVDPLTAGRYLDQIAGALEYAHERSTLHRNLSAACVYLQRDGRLLVGDFGVRRLIELGRPDAEQYAVNELDEACAPEQIMGGGVTEAADVYGLGATLFHLLAGSPVYSGATRQEVAQRHLGDRIPTLSATRAGIPVALDPLIARALAKEPERRFRQPGALANAYHQILAPNSGARVPFTLNTSAPVSGPSQPAPVAYNPSLAPRSPTPSPLDQSAEAYAAYAASGSNTFDALLATDTRAAPHTRLSAPPARGRQRMRPPGRPWVVALIALVVVAALAGGTLAALAARGPGAAPAATGSVTFAQSNASQSANLGRTDALRIVTQHLAAPPSGQHYAAWLINDQTESVFPLGSLVAQSGQAGVYTVSLAGQGAQPGQNLLALGNHLEVTLEQGTTPGPVGRVALSAVFPPLAFIHIQHLLVTFPTTPGQVGLLVGALDQTRLLDAQTQAFAQAVRSSDSTQAQCLAQSIVDIAEGAQGTNYRPLTAACQALGVSATGDGFGLIAVNSSSLAGKSGAAYSETGFLADASAHASLAATQPDTTTTIRTYARQVEVADANIQGWVTSLNSQAVSFLADPTRTQLGPSMLMLAQQAYRGQGAAHGGALAAFADGQQMATLALKA